MIKFVVGHVFIANPIKDLCLCCYKCGLVKSLHKEQVSLPTTPNRVIKESEEDNIGNYAD